MVFDTPSVPEGRAGRLYVREANYDCPLYVQYRFDNTSAAFTAVGPAVNAVQPFFESDDDWVVVTVGDEAGALEFAVVYYQSGPALRAVMGAMHLLARWIKDDEAAREAAEFAGEGE